MSRRGHIARNGKKAAQIDLYRPDMIGYGGMMDAVRGWLTEKNWIVQACTNRREFRGHRRANRSSTSATTHFLIASTRG